MLVALMYAPGLALADVKEHAFALHLCCVGSSGSQVTVDEGALFGVGILVSVATGVTDEDDDDDQLDALAAYLARDSSGRMLGASS